MAIRPMASPGGTPIPEWVQYPGDEWGTLAPASAGLDSEAFGLWVEAQNPRYGEGFAGQRPETGGTVIVRGGYVVHTWGNVSYPYQSASLGKAFTRAALQLAIDRQLIRNVDDPVRDYWTGEGLLAPHKVLTHGHHRQLTFRHLSGMMGGFPVTNGFVWQRGKASGQYTSDVPDWASWSGDPDHDNYAHIEPGAERCYSSGGYWRLSQALTAVWKRDLKEVLDAELLGSIGIPPERWDWRSGESVRNEVDFYPEMPGYGGFVDPPYTVGGSAVRGGGGWVVMGARDLARVGLLIATRGEWRGRRLISAVDGNAGVGSNGVWGWGRVKAKDGYFAYAKVAMHLGVPTPEEMAGWVAGPIQS